MSSIPGNTNDNVKNTDDNVKNTSTTAETVETVEPTVSNTSNTCDDDPPYRIMTEEEYNSRLKQISDAYDKLDDPNSYEQSMKRMGLMLQTSMLNQRYINSQPWVTIYPTKRPKNDDK